MWMEKVFTSLEKLKILMDNNCQQEKNTTDIIPVNSPGRIISFCFLYMSCCELTYRYQIN